MNYINIYRYTILKIYNYIHIFCKHICNKCEYNYKLTRRIFVYSLTISVLFIHGCGFWSVGPDFESQKYDDIPEYFSENTTPFSIQGDIALSTWWQLCNDPALIYLIEQGRHNSPSIESALLKIAQYRAQYAVSVGEFFPQTQEATATYTSEHPSKRTASAPQPGRGGLPGSIQQWDIGLQATWELDIWGKYRRNAQAALAALHGAHAAYELAQVSLSASIAQQYITYKQLEQQIVVAQRNSIAQKESVRLTKVMLDLGASTERDYNQAVAMQKSTEADIPDLRAKQRVARNALCILLGRPPGPIEALSPSWAPPTTASATDRHTGLTAKDTATAAVATKMARGQKSTGKQQPSTRMASSKSKDDALLSLLPHEVVLGIPAELIRRRPDVREAEAQAAAQCARIGVSKAQILPSFSISGFLGFQSSDVGAFSLVDTFTGKAFTASIAPSVVLPFLNYGRLYNAVRVQDALFQQSLVTYRQTVLTALQEAEDALHSYLVVPEKCPHARVAVPSISVQSA